MATKTKERPEGFKEDAQTMGVWQLMRKYNVGQLIIERWRGELDIEKAKNKVEPKP